MLGGVLVLCSGHGTDVLLGGRFDSHSRPWSFLFIFFVIHRTGGAKN